jgi:hypothetical protein
MEPGSETNQPPEITSGMDKVVSQIHEYITTLQRVTSVNQEIYDGHKSQGDDLGMARVESYLTEVICHIRFMMRSLHEATKDASENFQQSFIPLPTDLWESEQSSESSEAEDEDIA